MVRVAGRVALVVGGLSVAMLAGAGALDVLSGVGAGRVPVWPGVAAADTVYRTRLMVLPGICLLAADSIPVPGGGRAAAATLGPVQCAGIAYDTEWMRGIPSELAVFVVLHEVAHYALGHVRDGAQGRPIVELEREADCWAAQAYARYWAESIELVARLHEELPEFAAGDAEHDPGALRAELIRSCASGAGGDR